MEKCYLTIYKNQCIAASARRPIAAKKGCEIRTVRLPFLDEQVYVVEESQEVSGHWIHTHEVYASLEDIPPDTPYTTVILDQTRKEKIKQWTKDLCRDIKDAFAKDKRGYFPKKIDEE